MLKELRYSKNAVDYCGENFNFYFGTLEPWNPHRITNSFGGDPNLKWRFVKTRYKFCLKITGA